MVLTKDTEFNYPTINVRSMGLTDEQFINLCTANPDLRIEINSEGELTIMSPTFGDSGKRNSSLIGQIWLWNKQSKLGVLFDSSTGYQFANGVRFSPDVSWIKLDKLAGISLRQYIPVVPDLVIELRSSTDNLGRLQQKMAEYQELGVKLGWLINPSDRQVEVYRSGQEKEVLSSPTSLSGEDILVGFELDLTEIW